MLVVDNTEIFDWLKRLEPMQILLKILKTVTSIYFFPVVIKELIGVCFVRMFYLMHKPMHNFWNVALPCWCGAFGTREMIELLRGLSFLPLTYYDYVF